MWPFSRTKHPLPKFPPDVAPMFYSVCELLTEDAFAELVNEVEARMQDLSEDEDADKALHRQINTACKLLIQAYPELDNKNKKLVVGALRYCSIQKDAMPDHIFAAGFLDDIRVLNHVLEKIGIEGAFIRFGY